MGRFLVFGHDDYYPSGGWNDFKGGFGSIEEAMEFGKSTCMDSDTWYVIDAKTGSTVVHKYSIVGKD